MMLVKYPYTVQNCIFVGILQNQSLSHHHTHTVTGGEMSFQYKSKISQFFLLQYPLSQTLVSHILETKS